MCSQTAFVLLSHPLKKGAFSNLLDFVWIHLSLTPKASKIWQKLQLITKTHQLLLFWAIPKHCNHFSWQMTGIHRGPFFKVKGSNDWVVAGPNLIPLILIYITHKKYLPKNRLRNNSMEKSTVKALRTTWFEQQRLKVFNDDQCMNARFFLTKKHRLLRCLLEFQLAKKNKLTPFHERQRRLET